MTNHPTARQRPQLQHRLDASRWAVLVIALGWSLAGCGGSAKSPDGSATGTGGKSDGGPTDTAGATGGHAGSAGGGTSGAGGTSGTSGTAGSLGGVGGAGYADIGKACASTANCASGLTCMTAAGNVFLGTEGPANGYCSRPCAADADCGGVGICLRVSADSAATEVDYCFQTCTFGGTTSKCHDRNDVGCLTIDDTTTPTTDICYPLCSQDSDCPTGRHCDLGNSFCTDAAPTGDPLGTHCVSNPDSGTSNCAGGCLPVGSAAGGTTAVANFCSMLCVVGNLDACNWVDAGSSLKSGGSHGVCALASSTAQPGDIGFCTQECDVATDCSDQTNAAGLTCDTSLMSTIGHGLCSWG